MKNAVRAILYKVAPNLMRFRAAEIRRIHAILHKTAPDLMRLRAAKARRRMNRDLFGKRQAVSRKVLFENQDVKIMTGPFSGMKYIDEITWGPIEPKWLGTYEFELHDILDEIISENYLTVIDIGSAEGFYSVGMAWRNPECTVIAFDIDPISRRQQQALASLNGVENLNIRKFCDNDQLQELISDKTLVICDIEGSEMELLDLNLTPNLRKSDILVELHETAKYSMDEIQDAISLRFAESHSISVIKFNPNISIRKASMGSKGYSIDDALFDEYRVIKNQKWLWMRHVK